jgi:hypothetical protein
MSFVDDDSMPHGLRAQEGKPVLRLTLDRAALLLLAKHGLLGRLQLLVFRRKASKGSKDNVEGTERGVIDVLAAAMV